MKRVDPEAIRKCAASGLSMTETAKRLGIDRTTVRDYAVKLSIPFAGQRRAIAATAAKSTISLPKGHSTGRDREARVDVTVPPVPFELDISSRDETAPRAAPIRRPWRQTTPHEPVFIRELRRAFKEVRGLE